MLLLKSFLSQARPCLRHSDPSSHFGNHDCQNETHLARPAHTRSFGLAMFNGRGTSSCLETKALFSGEKRELPDCELDSQGCKTASQIQSSYMGYLRFLYGILMTKAFMRNQERPWGIRESGNPGQLNASYCSARSERRRFDERCKHGVRYARRVADLSIEIEVARRRIVRGRPARRPDGNGEKNWSVLTDMRKKGFSGDSPCIYAWATL